VRAVATIAGVTNLAEIHASPPERRARIDAAYNVTRHFPFERASKGHDPLNEFKSFPQNRIPLLAVASLDDALLPLDVHARPMIEISRATGSPSELIQISGPHIGDDHFTEQTAIRILDFFTAHGR